MAFKEVGAESVPGMSMVLDVLHSLDRQALLVAIGHEFDQEEYRFKIDSEGRKYQVTIPTDLLKDTQSDTQDSRSYTQDLRERVKLLVRKGISEGLQP